MTLYPLEWDWTFVVRIVIYALAVFRFTLLLYREAGPWYIFDWLRAKAGVEWVQKVIGQPEERRWIYVRGGEGFFAELLNCPYCLSGWIALGLLPGLLFNWVIFDSLAILGAIWALVYLLVSLGKYDEINLEI